MSADKISRAALLGNSSELAMTVKRSGLSTSTQTSNSQGIVIHEIIPGPNTSVEHPCFAGKHRWAYLTNGGVACGYCGTPRR